MDQFQAAQDAVNRRIVDLENLTNMFLREYQKATDCYQAMLTNHNYLIDKTYIGKFATQMRYARSLLFKLEAQIRDENESSGLRASIEYDQSRPGKKYGSLLIDTFPKRNNNNSFPAILLERYLVLLAIFNPTKQYANGPSKKDLHSLKEESKQSSSRVGDTMEKAQLAIESRFFSYTEIQSSVQRVLYSMNNLGLVLKLAEHARKNFPELEVHLEPREQQPISLDGKVN